MDDDGETDALGLTEADALTEAETDGETELDGDTDADGLTEADADWLGELLELAERDAETDGESELVGLTDADAETDGLNDGLAEAEAETLALSDAETEGLSDAVPPGTVTSFRRRPSNFMVSVVAGNEPSEASAVQVKTTFLMRPTPETACVIVPAIHAPLPTITPRRWRSSK